MAAKKKRPLSKTAKKKREALRKRTLKFRMSDDGRRIYKVTASRVDDEMYKLLVKSANERLRQIEKKGLTNESREYILVKRYASEFPEGKGAIYNVNEKTGAIRFSRNLPDFMTREKPFKTQAQRREYMINTLRNFLNAESSTIKGIRDIQKRGFETFKYQSRIGPRKKWVAKEKFKDLTFEQYVRFWKTYRENVADSKEDHYGYNSLKVLIENSTNMMMLSEENLMGVIQTIESTRKLGDDEWTSIENVKEKYGVEIGWND